MLLALDLSTTCTGWAYGDPNNIRPMSWGSIKPKSTLHRTSRIAQIVNELNPLMDDQRLTRVVAEDISVGTFTKKDGVKGAGNFKSSLALAEIRGALAFRLWDKRGMDIELANLSTVKSTLNINKTFAIRGTPTKADLRIIFDRMGMETKNEDESDAIAVWIATQMRREQTW